ncbi:MAG: hypothetical protein AMK72_03095 [Planctomycetes bacterium SM23_25]|nr:MAG: hypothetical protein AMK72_03095 [Planctomycetes bacterium SM23_25]
MKSIPTAMAAALLILIGRAPAQTPPQSPPAVKIGRDTTWILKPLKADGTPDYLAALNEQFGKGVTKDNNAFVALIEALGPGLLPEQIRSATLKALDVKLPTASPFLRPVERAGPLFEQFEAARKGPWGAADHPELAKWLKANAAPLAKVGAATSRSRFFVPTVKPKAEPAVIHLVIPQYGGVRSAARALVARANLAASEGRIDDALTDLLAAYRLGALVGQDYTVVGRLVAAAIILEVLDRVADLAVSGKVTAGQARAVTATITETGPPPSFAPALLGERYTGLDVVIWISKKPNHARFRQVISSTLAPQNGPTAETPVPAHSPLDRVFQRADYNVVLRRMNALYDEMAAAAASPTFAARVQEVARFRDRAERTRQVAAKLCSPKADRAAATEWVANMLVSALTPLLGRAPILMDLVSVRRDLALVAFALAAHRAEKGKYPNRLAALVPAHLKRLPSDFCSGKPFIYLSDGRGFVLYSVGENMRDDGGRGEGEGDDCDDIVLRTSANSVEGNKPSR